MAGIDRFLIQASHPRILLANTVHLVKNYFYTNLLRKRRVWEFDNGVKLHEDNLIGFQILRYKNINLHEPEVEKHFVTLMKKYSGDGVFLDVGAAAGYYSFLSKKLKPDIEVHAFNPNKNFAKMMKENMTLNNAKDIKIHEAAISDQVGTCDVEGGWGGKIVNGGNIPKTTISEFVNSIRKNVFLIKIDIQGEEFNALLGSDSVIDKIENIIMESHTPELHKKCLAFLKKNGFNISFESFEVVNQPGGLIVATKKS